MRRRVIELDRGRIVRDEIAGLYGGKTPTTAEFGALMRASRRPAPTRPARPPTTSSSTSRLDALRLLPPRGACARCGATPIPRSRRVATVLVTMLVLGVFIPIVQATNGAANDVRGRVLLDVYMKTDATAHDNARVRSELARHAARREGPVRLQGRRPTEQQAQERPRGLRAARRHNPLPDTFRRHCPTARATSLEDPRRADAHGAGGGRDRSTRRSDRSRTARTTRRRSSRHARGEAHRSGCWPCCCRSPRSC